MTRIPKYNGKSSWLVDDATKEEKRFRMVTL